MKVWHVNLGSASHWSMGAPALAMSLNMIESPVLTTDRIHEWVSKRLVSKRAPLGLCSMPSHSTCNILKRPLASKWAAGERPREHDLVRADNVADEGSHGNAPMLDLGMAKPANSRVIALRGVDIKMREERGKNASARARTRQREREAKSERGATAMPRTALHLQGRRATPEPRSPGRQGPVGPRLCHWASQGCSDHPRGRRGRRP